MKISFIHQFHRSPHKNQRLAEALVSEAKAMDISPLAELVECEEDRATCRELGFEFFGRPAVPSRRVSAMFAIAG